MPRIARSEVVVPSALSHAEREQLIDALYQIQLEVFDGVDRKSFASYVVNSKAEKTWILVHKDQGGAIVGYFALHLFARELGGQPVTIFRAEAGTRRAYRGGNANVRFGLLRGLRALAANPGRPIYYLGSLVHPSSYSLFAKYFSEVYPSAGLQTPPEMLHLMDEMADEFGLARVDQENPLVRQVGWKTRDTDAERAYWARCDRPAARFFVQTNGGYSQGHGLLTLVPVTLAALAAMGKQFVAQKLARIRDAVLAHFPRPGEALRQLQAAPLLAGVAPATLQMLASASQLEVKPGGSGLFRQGEMGDEVLVLARGAAYVLAERGDGEEHIIDEIGSGSLAGEMSALSGEPRTATVRTATSSMLVRIPRRALLVALETDAVLRERLWRLYCERRLDAHVRVHPHFRHLEHDRRRAWLRECRERRLAASGEASFEQGGYLFLATGSALLEQDGALISTRAPALVELRRPVKVVPQGEVRALLVPAI